MERRQQQPEEKEDRTRLLPDDVLADVLSRLAARGLATSRCVCAAWRAVVDGRGLLRADLLPPRALAGLFINYYGDLCSFRGRGLLFSRPPSPTSTSTTCSSYRLPYACVEDHCNGLLLLSSGAVLNPATGRRAPPPPECPPLPTGMEYFYRQMYLVFDPAADTAAEQYEVVSILRPPDRDVPDPDDELRRPAWPPVRRRRKVVRVGRSLLESEWPPSPYFLDVFSSATGRWEKRSFTRLGDAPGTTVADVQLDCRWVPHRRSVYWRGELYVHCENDFVLRISMSKNTYHIIKPPREVSDSNRGIYLHLGRSEKGVYSALCEDEMKLGSKLRVWILEESSRGEMEWILRHHISARGLVQASVNCGRREHGPWTLHGLCNPQGDDDSKEQVEHTFDEWNSDNDDGDDVNDRSTDQVCYGYLDIFGFHPYKEIVFLYTSRLDRGLAYHLKTSKLEDLGYLNLPTGSNADRIESCVPYTPCLAGKLPESE